MTDKFKQTLTLEDAMRISGPMAFNIMLKPAGSLCNLDCHYCYYLDKAGIYGGKEPRMSEQMLESIVKEYIEANDVPEVSFNWHGGEPLVLGKNFYKKALELQQKYANGKTIFNTLQTNGILLDREWAEMFRKNNFLIGISIDGPEDIHNKFRKDKAGRTTFTEVMRGVRLLQSSGVEFNTMTTVNKASEGRGLEVYQFLKSIGSRYMQFMAVLEHIKYPLDKNGKPNKRSRPYIVDPASEGAYIAPWSVSSYEWGKFLCDIFDYWVCNDVGQYFINVFDAALANWVGVKPGLCIYDKTCGDNTIIEHNGDLYSCDHFVYPKYLLGNVKDKKIRDMMESREQLRFGINKRNLLPKQCLHCAYLFACNGECPKHRFSKTQGGETGLNALCSGYKLLFKHIEPYMQQMRNLLLNKQAPAYVMPWAKMRQQY